jgi:hypothetical protein
MAPCPPPPRDALESRTLAISLWTERNRPSRWESQLRETNSSHHLAILHFVRGDSGKPPGFNLSGERRQTFFQIVDNSERHSWAKMKKSEWRTLKKKHHFWPENPQSPEKTFVFPLFFAYFNLRSVIELAILPNGPIFSL